MMMLLGRKAAKHRLQPPVRRMVDMVDARTGMVHLLTPDAVAAGRSGESRYVAVCGADVVPASLTELEQHYCWPCRSTTTGIPSQRSEIGSATVNWYPQFEKL